MIRETRKVEFLDLLFSILCLSTGESGGEDRLYWI